MKTATVKLTAAITVDGEIAKAGTILENIPEDRAKNLILRGRAELATASDEAVAEVEGEEEAEQEAEAETEGEADAKPKAKTKK